MSPRTRLAAAALASAWLVRSRGAQADLPTTGEPATPPTPVISTPLAPSSRDAVHATAVEARTPAAQGRRRTGFDSIFAAPWMPRFVGPTLIDRAVRDVIVAPTVSGQALASSVSDGMLVGAFLSPLVTSLSYTLAYHATAADFGELAAMDVGTIAVAIGLTEIFKFTVGRERPYATAAHLAHFCSDPLHERERSCINDRNASFLSGHSATSFTAAGLVCSQAAFFGPRSDAWDGVICGVSMAAATTTAVLRIVADRHYSSDTIAGGLLGLGMGLVLPAVIALQPDAALPLGGVMRTPSADLWLVPAAIGAGAGVVIGIGGAWLLSRISHVPLRHVTFANMEVGPVGAVGAMALGIRGTL